MPFDGPGYTGPMFLAGSPTEAPAPKPVNAWPTYYAHLTARHNAMRAWRSSWWTHWAALAEFILPYRYRYLVTPNTFNRGGPVNDRIIDETALVAMQICAHGLMSGLMSGSWFQLGVNAPWLHLDNEAREWLEDTQARLYTVLAGSNWYTTWAQGFRDVATFGTAPVLISEDFEDVIRLYLPCAGEYYLGLGGRLSVDTFYREFAYTVAQLVDRFKLENCPQEIQQFWQQGGASLEREFVVMHAIEPNFPLSPRMAAPKTRGRQKEPAATSKLHLVPHHFPWRSVYWLRGRQDDAPLEALGEHEQPFAVAGWAQTSNDPYRRGPGMDALAGTKQLQHQQERKGEFIDKGVRPPMGGHPQLQNKPASILPGELTFINTANGEKGFWPLFEVNPAHLQPMIEDIKEVQQRIRECFLVDVWMAISQMEGVQPRNELELMERRGEKLQRAGPVCELFETETLPVAMQRVLSIMQRRHLIKPLPRSLRGVPLKIDFRSTLKLMLRAGETAAIERGFQVGAKLDESAMEARQAGYDVPLPTRILKREEAYRTYLDRIAFPLKSIRSDEEVAQMDAGAAAQKRMQQTAELATTAINAGAEASKIDVGGGQNAVAALLGRPGGGAPSPQGAAA
jgi:hypothetical protein